MLLNSFLPFDSRAGDRRHGADDLARIIRGLLTDGVFPQPNTSFRVYYPSLPLAVRVQPGRCCIQGRLGELFSDATLSVDPPDETPRIDTVVLRMSSRDDRNITLFIKKGTPAANPVRPALDRPDATVHELGIADLYIDPSTSYILQSSITDTRHDSTRCGYVNSLFAISPEDLFVQWENIWREWLEPAKEKMASATDAYIATVQENGETAKAVFDEYSGTLGTFKDTLVGAANAWLGTFKGEKESEFREWFATLESTLDDNALTNIMSLLMGATDRVTLVEGRVTDIEPSLAAVAERVADIEPSLAVVAERVTGVEQMLRTDPFSVRFDNTDVETELWSADTTHADYPFRAAVPLAGVDSTMVPEVVFGLTEAVSGNFAPIVETYNGGVYLYAKRIPKTAFTIPTIIVWKAVV